MGFSRLETKVYVCAQQTAQQQQRIKPYGIFKNINCISDTDIVSLYPTRNFSDEKNERKRFIHLNTLAGIMAHASTEFNIIIFKKSTSIWKENQPFTRSEFISVFRSLVQCVTHSGNLLFLVLANNLHRKKTFFINSYNTHTYVLQAQWQHYNITVLP